MSIDRYFSLRHKRKTITIKLINCCNVCHVKCSKKINRQKNKIELIFALVAWMARVGFIDAIGQWDIFFLPCNVRITTTLVARKFSHTLASFRAESSCLQNIFLGMNENLCVTR